MDKMTHGGVVVSFPEGIEIPDRAGKLSPDEVLAIPKAPLGLGAACADAADALRNAGDKFMVPAGVTPEALEKAGDDAEAIDQVIAALEVVLTRAKQANLLLDAKAWELLRKVNDQVNAQAKTNPEVAGLFRPLQKYMTRRPRGGSPSTPA